MDSENIELFDDKIRDFTKSVDKFVNALENFKIPETTTASSFGGNSMNNADVGGKIDDLTNVIKNMFFDMSRGGSNGANFLTTRTFTNSKDTNFDDLSDLQRQYWEEQLADQRQYLQEELENLQGKRIRELEIERSKYEDEIELLRDNLDEETELKKEFLKEQLKDVKQKIKEEKSQLKASRQLKIQDIEKKLNSEQLSDAEKFFNSKENKRSVEYFNAHEDLKDRYGTFDKYSYQMRKGDKYNEIRDIKEGPLGNTFLGNKMEDQIKYGQKADDIGQMFKNAGNSKMVRNMSAGAMKFGRNIMGKNFPGSNMLGKGVSNLGNFTKALGSAGGVISKFGGSVLGVVTGLIDLAKAIAAHENRIADSQNKMADFTLEEKKLRYQRDSQQMSLKGDIINEDVNYVADLAQKQMSLIGQTELQKVQLEAQKKAKATEIGLGSFTDGINESAYAAYEASLDFKAQEKKIGVKEQFNQQRLAQFEKQRGMEYQYAQKGIEMQQKLTDIDYNTAHKQLDFKAQQEMVKDAANNIVSTTLEHAAAGAGTGAGVGGIVGTAVPGVGNGLGALVGAGVGGTIGTISGLGVALSDGAKDEFWARGAKQVGDVGNGFSDEHGGWEPDEENAKAVHSVGGQVLSNWGLISDKPQKIYEQNLKIDREIQMQIGQQSVDAIQNASKVEQNLMNKQTELLDTKFDILENMSESLIESELDEQKAWFKATQAIEKAFEEFAKISRDSSIALGFLTKNQEKGYRETVYNTVTKSAAKFGRKTEEGLAFQNSYAESTGRNRLFDKRDFETSFAAGMIVGDEMVQSFDSAMEIFNTGVSSANDMLFENLQQVNKIGLNSKKYTKTVVDSLKLAQKYNFKGGTDNVMKMAKWAENTRFNMSSLDSMLSKVSEGGLEGVITMGAQFQVLGGHAAMNADPLAMMYERYADPESFAKRMQDMTKGFGRIDEKTGESTFGMEEIMHMEQLAKIQGRSSEEVMNEVRARNKRQVVEKELMGDYDEDEKSFISNNAEFNKKTGKFQVKVMDGNEIKLKDVDQLKPEDLEKIIPEDHNEKMEVLMEKLVTAAEKMAGETHSEQYQLASENFERFQEEYEERLKKAQNNFIEHYDEIKGHIADVSEDITAAYGDFLNQFKEGGDKVQEAVDRLNTIVTNLANSLNQFNDRVKEYADKNKEIANNADKEIEKAKTERMNKVFDDYISRIGHDAGDLTKRMDKIQKIYEVDKSRNIKDYKNALSDGYNDLLDSLDAVYGRGDSIDDYDMEDIKRLVEAYKMSYKDGVVSGNGESMSVSASSITPIHDGKIARTDPKDQGLFAKTGGPFDTLFNGIFGKINDIYDGFNERSIKVEAAKAKMYSMISAPVSNIIPTDVDETQEGGLLNSLMNSIKDILLPKESPLNVASANQNGNTHLTMDTIKVEISGKLELQGGGQSVDIIKEIETNPSLLRTLSDMLGRQISQAMNGGRNTGKLNFGLQTFFN